MKHRTPPSMADALPTIGQQPAAQQCLSMASAEPSSRAAAALPSGGGDASSTEKVFHVFAICYYACCIFVDLSVDLDVDPLQTRSYYCAFFSETFDDWTWKNYFVSVAFLVLAPAHATALFSRIGRGLWTLNDTLTVAALALGAVAPISVYFFSTIQPLCALDPTDVAKHAEFAASLARWHAFVLSTRVRPRLRASRGGASARWSLPQVRRLPRAPPRRRRREAENRLIKRWTIVYTPGRGGVELA